MIILDPCLACTSLGVTYARVIQDWKHFCQPCNFIFCGSCVRLQLFGYLTWPKCSSCPSISLMFILLPHLCSQITEHAFHTLFPALPSSQPFLQLLLILMLFSLWLVNFLYWFCMKVILAHTLNNLCGHLVITYTGWGNVFTFVLVWTCPLGLVTAVITWP